MLKHILITSLFVPVGWSPILMAIIDKDIKNRPLNALQVSTLEGLY